MNSFGYYKVILIKEFKNLNKTNNGLITKQNAINVVIKSKIIDKIDNNKVKEIVDFYNKTENVEYNAFIAESIKDYKLFCENKNDRKYINYNYNNFKRNNFFNSNTFYKYNSKKDIIPKKSLSTFKIS